MIGKPIDIIKFLYEQDKDTKFEVKEHKNKRSLNANNYAWQLITQIADKLETTKELVYKQMLRDYGQPLKAEGEAVITSAPSNIDLEEVENVYCKKVGSGVVNGKQFNHYLLLRGSSTYDTKEMSSFIKGVVYEAKELEIETLTPQEIAMLKGVR